MRRAADLGSCVARAARCSPSPVSTSPARSPARRATSRVPRLRPRRRACGRAPAPARRRPPRSSTRRRARPTSARRPRPGTRRSRARRFLRAVRLHAVSVPGRLWHGRAREQGHRRARRDRCDHRRLRGTDDPPGRQHVRPAPRPEAVKGGQFRQSLPKRPFQLRLRRRGQRRRVRRAGVVRRGDPRRRGGPRDGPGRQRPLRRRPQLLRRRLPGGAEQDRRAPAGGHHHQLLGRPRRDPTRISYRPTARSSPRPPWRASASSSRRATTATRASTTPTPTRAAGPTSTSRHRDPLVTAVGGTSLGVDEEQRLPVRDGVGDGHERPGRDGGAWDPPFPGEFCTAAAAA